MFHVKQRSGVKKKVTCFFQPSASLKKQWNAHFQKVNNPLISVFSLSKFNSHSVPKTGSLQTRQVKTGKMTLRINDH